MERRKRRKRKSRKPIFGIVAVVIVFFCVLTYSFLHSTNQAEINREFSYKAAIVDHLSLSQPNKTFVETATNILEEAGYTVAYYPGEEVTVNFFRRLARHDFGLIVLRAHSALQWEERPPLCLFTSEPYSEMKYVYEQLTGQVGIVTFLYPENEQLCFGVSPKFIKTSMDERFSDTIIVMMGCDGLRYTDMAEAFIEKGAKAYLSWNGPVSASHTDSATTNLLKHLITEKQTIKQAVTETMKEVGSDPEYESILQYYPDV